MAAQFVVEDGTGLSTANALITVAEADQIMENYGDPTDWSAGSDDEKEAAIRMATRYLNLHYNWYGYKILETQALQWPRYNVYDEDGYLMANNEVPVRVKEAAAYLALISIGGETLLEDFQNESKVKKTKDVVGPLTEEREYVQGEDPEKSYQTADQLVYPFVFEPASGVSSVERG